MDDDGVRATGLRELLALHDAHRGPGALDSCLGDGYLLATNAIYRTIRAAALELGCRYTTDDFCHYHALRFTSLEAIVTSGAIPYCDNVSVVRALEQRRPGRFRFHDIFELARNYVLHESAHVIADRLYRARVPAGLAVGAAGPLATLRGTVLALNLMESFANTTELLARFAIESELDDLIFDLNSYTRGRPLVTPAYRELTARVGPASAFSIVLIAYAHANLLRDELPTSQIPELLELVAPDHARDPIVLDLVPGVAPACFRLSLRFRTLTQSFYVTYLGIDEPLTELLDFDVIATIRSIEPLRDYIQRLSDVVTGSSRLLV